MMAESEPGSTPAKGQAPGAGAGAGTPPPAAAGASGEFRQSPTKVLRTRFAHVYDQLFKGEDPSAGNEQFWNELFLLKVNAAFLEKRIGALSEDGILGIKDSLNTLFVRTCEAMRDDSDIRVANAMLTSMVLLRAVFQTAVGKSSAFTAINILMGFDQAEARSNELFDALHSIITKDSQPALRALAVKYLVVLVTASDNISQNTLVEYLANHSIFDALLSIFQHKDRRETNGPDALFIIAVLVNYRKNEGHNPYAQALAELSDAVVLNAFGSIVLSALSEHILAYAEQVPLQPAGFLSSVTDFMSSMFVTQEESTLIRVDMKRAGSLLLALYEIVHLCPSFVVMLTHTQVLSAEVPDAQSAKPAETPQQPGNLFSILLTYTSYMLQATRDPDVSRFVKLTFIVFTCITEDSHANGFIHDDSHQVPVTMHRAAMRHRPASTNVTSPGPLAAALLDVCIEFLLTHLKKSVELDLFGKCLGIIHRVLCYQKKQRIRLPYSWKDLWSALVGLLKFLGQCAGQQKIVYSLEAQVVNIFNLFITYGDTFLPDPSSYDMLYYELIRVHKTFDALYDTAKREMRITGPHQTAAGRLASDLVNIRAITNHFTPKIDAWSSANQITSLTPEQVLAVVRDNYDTLTLKLQDNLDHFGKYAEHPNEVAFFTALTRSVLAHHRAVDLDARPGLQPALS